MNFLQKLFGAPRKPEKRYYVFTVKCNRCGETIEGRVDLDNDPSVEYEEGGDVYHVRKALIGESRCFQRIETTFKFTPERTLIQRDITGGEFI